MAIIAKTQEELQDMVNRLVDTGRKYGMEINIDKSQVMRVSRSNESLQIKVNNRELKEVDHFKYLGSVRTRDGYCTREIKMRITIAKEALAEVGDFKIGGRIINKVRFANYTAIIAKTQEELQDMMNRLVEVCHGNQR